MKKQYLIASFIISGLLVPVLAGAATAQEIQAQIQSLLSQITALQQQLSSLTSNTSTTISTASNSCPNLYRALLRGSRGSDVISLQQFLIAQGLLRSDLATGFFGLATEEAVQRWQAQNSIVSSGTAATTGWGSIGVRSRAKIARSCGAGTTPSVVCEHAAPPASCHWESGRTCADDRLVCPERTPQSCVLDNVTVQSGSSRKFYSASAVSATTCDQISQMRTCTNGTLSGSNVYQHASCEWFSDVSPMSCSLDGATVQSGQSASFYSKNIVYNYDGSCANYTQTRTCTNGALSGSSAYQYASCRSAPMPQDAWCTLDGATVQNGQSATFYSTRSVQSPNSCSSVSQVRTCNGVDLSGSSAYQYASCSVTAACNPECAAPPAGCHYEGGTSCSCGQLVCIAPLALNSIAPASGPAGTAYPIQATITGSGFMATGNTVTFGPVNVTDLSSDGSHITFYVPKSMPSGGPPMVLQPGDYQVTVTSNTGTSNTLTFTLTN